MLSGVAPCRIAPIANKSHASRHRIRGAVMGCEVPMDAHGGAALTSHKHLHGTFSSRLPSQAEEDEITKERCRKHRASRKFRGQAFNPPEIRFLAPARK